MGGRDVCLIDVYETLLTVDFASASGQLAGMAGAPREQLRSATESFAPGITTGELTMAEALRRALLACDVEPDDELVRDLVDADRRLLVESVRLHDDTMPFLAMLSDRGVRSALVSNCAENTRPLLAHLGLDLLVDAIVLSCEVGCAKPAPQIYRRALDELRAEPPAAILVDDQASYCDGATLIGIAAAQIVRNSTVRNPAASGTIVRSLMEVEHLL
jgi:putative hydrolase of the HAD superfamily